MSIQPTDSFEDVAFKVCTAIRQYGITAVLTGGGAAAIYAPEAGQAPDSDLVLSFALSSPNAKAILDLGFETTSGHGIYRHPKVVYPVEILEGPLAVGEEVLTTWETRQREDLVLHLVTPTDCVRQLLTAAMETGETAPVELAAEVAIHHRVEMGPIQSGCKGVSGARTYALFRHLILI